VRKFGNSQYNNLKIRVEKFWEFWLMKTRMMAKIITTMIITVVVVVVMVMVMIMVVVVVM